MTLTEVEIPFSELTNPQNYTINSLSDEIKADQHCKQLLKHFHRWLIEVRKCEALEAGQFASGADYFLREFLVGAQRVNIFNCSGEQLRQFGGNWYIISNLEPNINELEPMLSGAAHFYLYCAEQELIDNQIAKEISTVADQVDNFQNRINDFHNLQGDGYGAWAQACPLK